MADSDNLYSRILREMYSPAWLRKGGRESYVGLAKKLGIDDQTVRNAIGRMQKSGFLKTWTVSLNPHIFGMECASVLVKAPEGTPSSKERVISQLKLVEGVVAIFSFLDDPGLRLVFDYEDDDELEKENPTDLFDLRSDRAHSILEDTLPAMQDQLKKTDWQIIRFLLKDSRKNVSEIAEAIGVSTRTVTRRLAVMAEDSSFFLSPIVDVKKVDGFLYHFIISYDEKKNKGREDATAIESLYRSVRRIVFVDTSAERYTVLAAICQNISEAHQISDWLRTLDGVIQVTVGVLEDVIFVHDWIDHEIEKRLRA